MTRRFIAAFVWALLLAAPAGAQFIGTPGSGPLTPDGPRRGLGPPSITDNVPDLRLHGDRGGMPGAGPPLNGGAGRTQPLGSSGFGVGYGAVDRRPIRMAGRSCSTPRRSCVLIRPAPVGTACSCRLPSKARARGHVVP